MVFDARVNDAMRSLQPIRLRDDATVYVAAESVAALLQQWAGREGELREVVRVRTNELAHMRVLLDALGEVVPKPARGYAWKR